MSDILKKIDDKLNEGRKVSHFTGFDLIIDETRDGAEFKIAAEGFLSVPAGNYEKELKKLGEKIKGLVTDFEKKYQK